MLAKLTWLKAKLDEPAMAGLKALRDAAAFKGSPYHWLATAGAIHITANSPQARRLALAGLRMPSRHIVLP